LSPAFRRLSVGYEPPEGGTQNVFTMVNWLLQNTKVKLMQKVRVFAVMLSLTSLVMAQEKLPDEIRGYKVQQAKVIVRNQSDKKTETANDNADADAIVEFGEVKLASVSPLGITFEIPVTMLSPNQSGRIDFLTFDKMKVNGLDVKIEEYQNSFEMPKKQLITLSQPIRVFVSTPQAFRGALGEIRESKKEWQVQGRVYVFGKFKKSIFKFKRVVPVDFDITIASPVDKINPINRL
jgi:hypothetical protein